MDAESFCWGFVVGALLIGAWGFAAQRMLLARTKARAADRKQTIYGETAMTPREAIRRARGAQMEIALWVVVMIASVGCGLFLLLQAL